MSNVPLSASTTPASLSWPSPARAAATKVNRVPAMVTWLGVIGSRPISRAIRCALRLTHAWKRVVNTRLHLLVRVGSDTSGAGPPRFLIDLDHPRRDRLPAVALRFRQSSLSQAPAQQRVAGDDGQRRAELDRALRADRQAVHTGLHHRQV